MEGAAVGITEKLMSNNLAHCGKRAIRKQNVKVAEVRPSIKTQKAAEIAAECRRT